MIIQSIHAENFRKYELLDIRNLPEKGLITISGSNESGKTSIADALSFALFGRTYLTEAEHASKLILWGAKNASVTLTFSKQGKTYQLTRIITKDGSIDTQLLSEEDASVLADTPEETEQMLQEILGYGYETFSDSFYLVQRELTTPHPNSDSVKDMVGIGAYSRINNEMNLANKKDDEKLAEIRPQYEVTYQELQAMGIDDTWLPELAEARDTLETGQAQKKQLAMQLQTSADDYSADAGSFKRYTSKHRWAKLISDFLLALVIGVLVLWGLFEFAPELAKKYLLPDSPESYAKFDQWAEKWMLLIGASLALLFFLSLLRTWRIEDKHLIPLRDRGQLMADTLTESHQHAMTDIDSIIPGRTAELMQKNQGLAVLSTPPEEDAEQVRELIEASGNYQADPKATEDFAHRLRFNLKDQVRQMDQYQDVVGVEIEQEMTRTEEAGKLRKKLSGFDKSIREHTRNIKVQNTAIELLKESSREFTDAFNASITKSSSGILPHFTGGRYRNLKIDENLDVRVFSEDKNDFMDFDEISSGTQRQIMLALRIAMSEELARNTNNTRQFIMLDEPFAFFDHDRTVATLNKLSDVSDVICQVWVVSQEFPDGTQADREIVCTMEKELT
jgi:exonuclease SbcC